MAKMDIKNTILEIENLSKLLKESYVFDGEDYEASYGDEEMCDEEPMEGEVCDSGSCDKIDQIRSLALDGIQDFAKDVDTEEYQFYKKVWLLCDKFCETDKSNNNVE